MFCSYRRCLHFFLALVKGPSGTSEGFEAPSLMSSGSIMFIVALMGWMPTAVDLSTWNSLWTIERIKQTGYRPTLKETLRDFNLGYIISALLAICFVTLGAYMLYGSDTVIPDGSAAFSHSIIGMFTEFIGEWSYIVIAAATFSIMFGTCIAVFLMGMVEVYNVRQSFFYSRIQPNHTEVFIPFQYLVLPLVLLHLFSFSENT